MTTPDINAMIENFVNYGRSEISQIVQLQGPQNSPKPLYEYKKVLLAAVIDSHARCVFPRGSNRERFVEFMRKFSGWAEIDHVSLTQLEGIIQHLPGSDFGSLRKYVEESIATWRSGSLIPLSQDPPLQEILPRWPKREEHGDPLGRLPLEHLTHGHLFYTYRNSLVHELRAPGYSWDMIDREEPSYMGGVNNLDGGVKDRWLLVYPLAFFVKVCLQSLTNLERYLKAGGIDPYQSYTFGEYWIERLNE